MRRESLRQDRHQQPDEETAGHIDEERGEREPSAEVLIDDRSYIEPRCSASGRANHHHDVIHEQRKTPGSDFICALRCPQKKLLPLAGAIIPAMFGTANGEAPSP